MNQQQLTGKILNLNFRMQAKSRESAYIKPKLESLLKERTALRQAEIDNERKIRSDKKY